MDANKEAYRLVETANEMAQIIDAGRIITEAFKLKFNDFEETFFQKA